MASMTRELTATTAETEERHSHFLPLNTLIEAMALDLPNPVILRPTLTLLTSSPKEHNLALETMMPAIASLSPEPVAKHIGLLA